MLLLICTTCLILQPASTIQTLEEHFVKCINTIVEKYITPGQSVVVSVLQQDNNYTNQQSLDYVTNVVNPIQYADLLIVKLHEPLSWPLQIYSPDNLHLDTSEEITRYGCYVIMAWASKTEDEIIDSIENQISELAAGESWNNRALFIVAVIGEFKKATDYIITEILDLFWGNYKVFNILILVVPLQEGEHVIQIYSWIPFMGESYCYTIEEAVILDKWIMEGDGRFIEDNKLYSDKIPRVMKGCKLRVAILFISPYAEMFPYTNNENVTVQILDGYDTNVFSMVMKIMNMTAEFDLENPNISMIEKAAKIVADIVFNKDAGFGSLPAHYIAIYFVDFTYHISETAYRWYVPCPQQISRLARILKIFSVPLWLAWITSFIFGSLFIWLVAQAYKILKMTQTEHQCYTDKLICGCYTLSISLGVSIWKMPRTNALRSFLITWTWYCFAMSTVFQTFFTSFLVNPGIHEPFKTIEEVMETSIEFGYDKMIDYFVNDTFKKSSTKIAQSHKFCSASEDCFTRYLRGEFATISNDFETKYIQTYLGGYNPICFLDENIVSQKATIYLMKGSPFLERVNEIIIQLWEGGHLIKIEKDYLTRVRTRQIKYNNISYQYEDSIEEDEYFVFSVSHLQIGFYVLLYGYSLSFILCCFENIVYELMN
ncbi:hypothetical protein L9F63_015463 [Diploptera punctata]|uniref:Uncharacterized protein n=1 Tax=Diploptera punctata TaxID=6984 RepID=A0AAD8EJG9_DIPPU|nr:hypothetical protein L9F63_015463 [Diploptera punctata]